MFIKITWKYYEIMSLSRLTDKQREVFEFLLEQIEGHERWPTFQEIADHIGAKSRTSVAQIFDILVKKNFLMHEGHGSYTIHPTKRYLLGMEEDAHAIPIRGVITAGRMAEAVDVDMGSLSLDYFFKNPDSVFCLKVAGNSMERAGIEDGDYVLLTKTEIRNGDIAAVIYNDETTLKRIYFEEDGLLLVPESEEHEPIKLEPDEAEEITLLGKYVGKANKNGLFLEKF